MAATTTPGTALLQREMGTKKSGSEENKLMRPQEGGCKGKLGVGCQVAGYRRTNINQKSIKIHSWVGTQRNDMTQDDSREGSHPETLQSQVQDFTKGQD